MPRKPNTRIPSAGFESAAKKAAERGRKSVFKAFQAAQSLIEDRFGTYADQHLGPENARLYKAGLKIEVKDNPLEVSARMDDEITEGLEEGYPSFDIKAGMLASGSVKTAKDGALYIDVPFSHAGKDVPRGIKGALDRAAAGSKSDGIQARLEAGRVHPDVHTSGMVKTGEGYRTFRRISIFSPSKSWIHPGFAGIHAAQMLVHDLTENVMRIVRDFLKKGDDDNT